MSDIKAIKSKATIPANLLAIKTLKTYQPVQFNKNLDKHFTAERPGMEGMVITFDTDRQIIIIEQQGRDKKVVVPANVEFLELLE